MKLATSLLACLLAAAPAAALADSHGGDHGSARGGFAPSRTYQSAPRFQQQQAPRYAPQAQRFAPQAQRFAPQAPRPEYRNVQPLPRYQVRPVQPVQQHTVYGGYHGGSYSVSYREGDHIMYRGYDARPWGWNSGRIWAPSPAYWGGGFWGGLAIGLAVNDYTVQPESPGYDLLGQYGLQQTDCEQPNLVQITGPDGSEICAYPNDQVGPGQYQVDPSTLTLISE